MKKLAAVIFMAVLGVAAAGCAPSHTQVFKKSTNPYAQVRLKAEDIVKDVYYVKNGTDFVAVYSPQGKTFTNKSQSPSSSRVVWLGKDEEAIPTMYKGDVLALKADSTNLSSVVMERFVDVGYSIGIHGAVFDSGKIVFSHEQNTGKGTPASTGIDGKTSDNIELLAVNSQEVQEGMLDASGVLTCFEKGETYQLSYNTGTTYKTCKVSANVHTLESWEMYDLTDIEMTKRGYMQISLPEDLKSGWYFIEGQGFIKYIGHEKGQGSDPSGEDMNQKYYTSDEARRAAYSQVFSVTFEKKTFNPTLEIVYDEASLLTDQYIEAYFISPDGTSYVVSRTNKPALDDEEESSYKLNRPAYLTCDLKEAIAGKWSIYVAPKNLTIAKVKILSNGLSQEAREDDEKIVIDEDKKNVTFYVDYMVNDSERDPYVSGIVVYPDGTSYNLEKSKKVKNELSYDASYLPAGEYIIKFYHYSNVEVKEAALRENEEVTGQEIINITG